MITMQYKIKLPNDYDMDIIRKRVQLNGMKTDGFQDLIFKAYLISENEHNKQYAPLYLWENQEGMNKFIFDGYFDNILNSFYWTTINIAVPITVDITNNLANAKYVLEVEHPIVPTTSMKKPNFTYPNENCFGKILTYNPDKWQYSEFYFYQELPPQTIQGSVYEILHISE
ncbi:DUF4865 family protein [Culicoidibacter larvae]|uniref:DUF4865 family protein n=1 Tax=Culicoidibacter larvae TaxID=2579976 RepID=A0A5R8QAR7_9FIRM|nr:DUF4865 family protein [Culicoidibacter larvae]TLG72960.1 DUF4865 family protein [Culicoidibacter larvae]